MQEDKNELIPLGNCMRCKYAKKCEDLEDGSCYISLAMGKIRNGAKLHECYGFALTVEQWAKFLKVARSTVTCAVNAGGLERLFDRCVEREYNEMHKIDGNEEEAQKPGAIAKQHEFFGTTHTVADWAKILGVAYSTVAKAIQQGVFEKRYGKRYRAIGGE